MGSMASGIGNIFTGAQGGAQETAAAQQEWDINKALAQYGARTATLKGQQEVSDIRAAGTQVGESQKLAYANSNVDPTVGTAAAVQSDTAAQSELDAQTAKNNAARAAWGYKVQGSRRTATTSRRRTRRRTSRRAASSPAPAS
jgi:hypothetical protein